MAQTDSPLTDTALTGDSGGLWDSRRIENFIAFARLLERDLAKANADKAVLVEALERIAIDGDAWARENRMIAHSALSKVQA